MAAQAAGAGAGAISQRELRGVCSPSNDGAAAAEALLRVRARPLDGS